MVHTVGDDFQFHTKYNKNKMTGGYLDWANKPDTYKQYLDNKKIELPFSREFETLSFDEAVRRRRSVRSFSEQSLSLMQLGYLLWSSTGIQRVDGSYEFRNAPSAGALYPIETYLFAKKVDTIDMGLYHYNIKSHLLEQIKTGDFSDYLANSCLGQSMLSSAPVVFIWSAVFSRSKWKYKQRAYRYIYLDCGHIAQNLAMSATSMGLGSCQIGAFYDDELNNLMELDEKQESVVYLSAVGHPI
ncbi:MAG: SagB/ThcOx family dehydrogenase [Candidatus Bathyarchaeota archaeon]|nr:MAG: SagB/ThcOx family dehydrogenase [Candidatus Bathyarchaeota archaeon]